MSKKYFLVDQRGINYQRMGKDYQKIIPRTEKVSCKSNFGLRKSLDERF